MLEHDPAERFMHQMNSIFEVVGDELCGTVPVRILVCLYLDGDQSVGMHVDALQEKMIVSPSIMKRYLEILEIEHFIEPASIEIPPRQYWRLTDNMRRSLLQIFQTDRISVD